MKGNPKKASEPAPDPTKKQISDQEVRECAAAALEVLDGADAKRILAMMDKLVVAKLLLGALARGEVLLRQEASPTVEAAAAPRRS